MAESAAPMREVKLVSRIMALEKERGALTKALKRCAGFQPHALNIFRKHKFVFAGKGGRWEKLAFTLYTDLCAINSICRNALEEDKE